MLHAVTSGKLDRSLLVPSENVVAIGYLRYRASTEESCHMKNGTAGQDRSKPEQFPDSVFRFDQLRNSSD